MTDDQHLLCTCVRACVRACVREIERERERERESTVKGEGERGGS